MLIKLIHCFSEDHSTVTLILPRKYIRRENYRCFKAKDIEI